MMAAMKAMSAMSQCLHTARPLHAGLDVFLSGA
jgi:hypothetical protein